MVATGSAAVQHPPIDPCAGAAATRARVTRTGTMPGCQQPMIRRRNGRCRRSRPDIPAATVPPPRSPLRPPPVLLRRRTGRRRLSATEHRRERDHAGAGRSCFDGEVRYGRRCGSFDAEPTRQRRRRPPGTCTGRASRHPRRDQAGRVGAGSGAPLIRRSATGRRCTSRHLLQIDHIRPWARGGGCEPANLRLLCHAHHQHLHAGPTFPETGPN